MVPAIPHVGRGPDHDPRRGPSGSRLWLILILAAVLALVITAIFFWSLADAENTARKETERIRIQAAVAGSLWYCHNGYGRGLDNEIPWWSETHVADVEPTAYVEAVRAHLGSAGYDVAVERIVDSEARPDRGMTYWELTGLRQDRFSVTARISTGQPTFNHCFEGFSDFAPDVDPADFDSILVLHVRDVVG